MTENNPFKNQCFCKELELYQSFSAALENTYYSKDWGSFSEYFSEDIIYRQNSEPFYSIEAVGKENVQTYYETHFDRIEHSVDGKRSRGDIYQLATDVNYLKVWVDIIYSFSDQSILKLNCEEQVWFNDQGKIKKIVLEIPSTQIEQLVEHLEKIAAVKR